MFVCKLILVFVYSQFVDRSNIQIYPSTLVAIRIMAKDKLMQHPMLESYEFAVNAAAYTSG